VLSSTEGLSSHAGTLRADTGVSLGSWLTDVTLLTEGDVLVSSANESAAVTSHMLSVMIMAILMQKTIK